MERNTGNTASLCMSKNPCNIYVLFCFFFIPEFQTYFHISSENYESPHFLLWHKIIVPSMPLVAKKPVAFLRQKEHACQPTRPVSTPWLLRQLYQANSCCLSGKACWLPGLGFHTHWILHKALYFWASWVGENTPSPFSNFVRRRNQNTHDMK